MNTETFRTTAVYLHSSFVNVNSPCWWWAARPCLLQNHSLCNVDIIVLHKNTASFLREEFNQTENLARYTAKGDKECKCSVTLWNVTLPELRVIFPTNGGWMFIAKDSRTICQNIRWHAALWIFFKGEIKRWSLIFSNPSNMITLTVHLYTRVSLHLPWDTFPYFFHLRSQKGYRVQMSPLFDLFQNQFKSVHFPTVLPTKDFHASVI
jgi:hypothetical protein